MSEVENVADQIEKMIGDKNVDAASIMSICISAMQLVERMKDLKGEQKKTLVLDSLSKVIEKKGGDLAILAVIPQFIDSCISIEKGQIRFKLNTGLFSCCIGKK